MKTKRVKDNGILLEKETYYTLTLNQLQLDIVCELVGRVTGENKVRNECDEIYQTLFKYSSQNNDPLVCPEDTLFQGIIKAKDPE